MNLDISRLIIRPEEINVSRCIELWSYLVSSPGEVLGFSPFGDWFFLQEDLLVWRLSLLEGSFEPIAQSVLDFHMQLQSEEQQDDWLQAGLVLALEGEGKGRAYGECYTYRVHPRLGGLFERANIGLEKMEGWQAFCAQLHPQLDVLPEDARITRLEVDSDGILGVEWTRE
jgi:hypothetical protein